MTSSIKSMTTWPDLDKVLHKNSSFLISSHAGTDGDSIGSSLAMYWYLSSLGKKVVLFNKDPMPTKFAFLTNSNVLTTVKPTEKFDVGIVLDSSNPSRLGWEGLTDLCPTLVNIDHHRDNSVFGDYNVIQIESAATGQIMYDFFCTMHIEYPAHVAEALYVAIMTDTGAFRFSNTNGTVLRICADLYDKGVAGSKMYELVYASFSPAGLLVQSRIWSMLTFYHDNKICSMEMKKSLIDELGATYGDSEGMSDCTVLGTGVLVGMMIKYDDKETHFSLRSRGHVDVCRIAQTVPGGGGHSNAAGCTMQLPYAEAKKIMLDTIIKALA